MKTIIFFIPLALIFGCNQTKTSNEDVVSSIEFKTGISLDKQEKIMISKRNPVTLTRLQSAEHLQIEDIITLCELGISDHFIMNYLKEKNTIYNLRHIDVLKLQKSGVSQQIIHKLIDSGR